MPGTCYYELLGVGPKASAEEIKKGYRKAALQWHPDKNADRIEEATARFKEIQNAHAILSDPQERSWYDGHKAQILRGEGSGDSGSDDEDDGGGGGKELMRFFSSSCYTGFGDDAAGFYTTYRNVFGNIDEEEEMEEAAGTYHSSTSFGDSLMGHREVGDFYRDWSDFVTKKEFRSAEKYNLAEAPDRWVRRKMEAENKTERKKARKEFNETVRKLVEFVRKRDPRWKARETWLADEKARKEIEQAKEIAAERRRKSAARDQLKIAAAAAQAERDRELQEMIDRGEIDGLSESDSSEEEAVEYYCKACAKAFKTDKAWDNHRQSKKHIARVKHLIREGLYDEDDEDDDDADEDEREAEELSEEGAEFSYAHYSVKVLKEALREAGIDFSDCVEKADLVARCAEIPDDYDDSDLSNDDRQNSSEEEEQRPARADIKQALGESVSGSDEDEEEAQEVQPPPGLSSKEKKKWLKRQERLKRRQENESESFRESDANEGDSQEDGSGSGSHMKRNRHSKQGVRREQAPEPAQAAAPLPARKTEECFDCAGAGALGRGKKAKKCKACNGSGMVRVAAADEEDDGNTDAVAPVRLTAKQKKAQRKQKAQEQMPESKVAEIRDTPIAVPSDFYKSIPSGATESDDSKAAQESKTEQSERVGRLNRRATTKSEERGDPVELVSMEDVNSNDKLAGNADPLAATLSKRDKRRAKNAAKKAAAKEADEGGSIIAGNGRSDGADDGHECKVCHSFFESRSKLFKHIEQTGHATLKGDAGGKNHAKTVRKKKKK